MCSHTNVIVLPTEENSWGIDDTYSVKCASCQQTIISNISQKNLRKYLMDNHMHVISGFKYIP
jgi:hypothetical protein